MNDFLFDEAGDIARDSSGDIAVTQTPWRDDVQQAYIRLMTDMGDFLLYPTMGCDLAQLTGMPQSPSTAQVGINLITSGLQRENKYALSQAQINAVPMGYQTIRFDVFIPSGSLQLIRLSVEQNLGVI